MNTRHQNRPLRLFGSLVVAAALAAPAAAGAGGSDPTLRNDIAHHGRQTASSPSDPTLRNDVGHNGTGSVRALPAAIVVHVDGGFDWISAGVGAAGGGGLLLVLGAATATLRRRDGGAPAGA